MFFACGIWCVADVSSVSPSSEQKIVHTHIYSNARNVSYRLYPTGEKHTLSTFVDQPVFNSSIYRITSNKRRGVY